MPRTPAAATNDQTMLRSPCGWTAAEVMQLQLKCKVGSQMLDCLRVHPAPSQVSIRRFNVDGEGVPAD